MTHMTTRAIDRNGLHIIPRLSSHRTAAASWPACRAACRRSKPSWAVRSGRRGPGPRAASGGSWAVDLERNGDFRGFHRGFHGNSTVLSCDCMVSEWDLVMFEGWLVCALSYFSCRVPFALSCWFGAMVPVAPLATRTDGADESAGERSAGRASCRSRSSIPSARGRVWPRFWVAIRNPQGWWLPVIWCDIFFFRKLERFTTVWIGFTMFYDQQRAWSEWLIFPRWNTSVLPPLFGRVPVLPSGNST